MLVLSRKLQQQIKIGDEITVTVLRVKGNTVRIGVQAPREVRVVRGELQKQTAEQVGEAEAVAETVTVAVETAEETAKLAMRQRLRRTLLPSLTRLLHPFVRPICR